jgi:phenylalanyl-tRNA synthetase alpha chain
MLDKLREIKEKIISESEKINSGEKLEEFRIKYLARKGMLNDLFEEMKSADKSIKGLAGKHLNELKNLLQEIYDSKKNSYSAAQKEESVFDDITLPGKTYNIGTKHLINQALDDILKIFQHIGFSVYEGFEIEDEYHNFDALNTPEWHPSRDMQDTFYLDSEGKDKRYLLRTHTSPGQIRVMESMKPPLRVLVPGKCYRNEAISSRSLSMFHQVEGIYVDKNVTFGHLKGALDYFAKSFFGKDLKTRMRPSYFPFTEPSGEMDVECFLCKGKGCKICKHTGWLEILGCGMIDPYVFEQVGYDTDEYTGYAFGMGLERTLMIKHGIPDIRMFYENDLRFLKQF